MMSAHEHHRREASTCWSPSSAVILGSAGIGKQIKYADEQQIHVVLMYGGDEKSRNVVTLKDMQVGQSRTGQIGARDAWLRERPGQIQVPRQELTGAIKGLLDRIET